MNRTSLFVLSAMLLAGISLPTANAQESSVVGMEASKVQAETQADIEAYWTPERLRSAKPMELHAEVGSDGLAVASETPAQAATSISVRGAGPSLDIGNQASRVLAPGGLHLETQPQGDVIPDATSSYGAYFTTLRVFPDATTLVYPYRATGQLFFTDPTTGGNFVCTSSVLRWRVIVMAGHCVAHGSTTAANRYFYTNFLFVPSENNGVAPNGTWTWSYVATTTDWYNNGAVPNQQDVGMLVAVDQKIGGSGPFKIGQVTGFLGYRYCNGTNCSAPAISNNNITMIGYPCNLDNCTRMEQTNAQTFASGGSNTWIYGSVMRAGASGGPWIQDFGVAPVGAPAGLLGNNLVIAVTSYGPPSMTPMYLGASAFDSRFNKLLTSVCSHAGSGGC